jgi:hypothetical protein
MSIIIGKINYKKNMSVSIVQYMHTPTSPIVNLIHCFIFYSLSVITA